MARSRPWFPEPTGRNQRLRRAEDQRIATLERQRDTLVREVHRRIKNHLQGVPGLLRGASTDSPHLEEPLGRVIAQIHAIAQVHGLLSRDREGSIGLTIIELVETAVGGAAEAVLVDTAPTVAESTCVIIGDDAVAIALVINELITNAIKRREAAQSARPVRVVVADDGESVTIVIRNEPALIAAMLPAKGVDLMIRQRGRGVEASLTVREPVIVNA